MEFVNISPNEPDHYELTSVGRAKCKQYLEEIKAKRKEILDAKLDTVDETRLPSEDEMLDDLLLFGIDIDGEVFDKQPPHTRDFSRVRLHYTHIASVISRKAAETEDKLKGTNNYEWIVPHRFSHNTNTNKDYVQMTTVPKHSNTKSKYFINGKEATFDEVKPYVIPSYFSKKPESGNEVRTINVDNIKWIKQRGNIA